MNVKRTLNRARMAPTGGFHGRLLQLIGSDKPFAWARRMGVSSGAMQNLLKGGMPQDKTIARIVAETGVDREWLLYGKGEMRSPAPAPYSVERVLDEHIDAQLLGDLVEAIEEEIEKTDRKLSPGEKARLVTATARIYSVIREADPKGSLRRVVQAVVDLFSTTK